MLVLLEVGIGIGIGFVPARRPRLPAVRVLCGPRGGTDPRPGRAISGKSPTSVSRLTEARAGAAYHPFTNPEDGDLFGARFDGMPVKLEGTVKKTQGKFVWVEPTAVTRAK